MQLPEVGQTRSYITSSGRLRRVKITRLDTETINGLPVPVFDGDLLNPDDTPCSRPQTVWGYYDQLLDESEVKHG